MVIVVVIVMVVVIAVVIVVIIVVIDVIVVVILVIAVVIFMVIGWIKQGFVDGSRRMLLELCASTVGPSPPTHHELCE